MLEQRKRRLIRLDEVKQKTGLSRSTIYLWMEEERFPQSVKIGGHSTAWVEEEIDEWIKTCIDQSRNDNFLTTIQKG